MRIYRNPGFLLITGTLTLFLIAIIALPLLAQSEEESSAPSAPAATRLFPSNAPPNNTPLPPSLSPPPPPNPTPLHPFPISPSPTVSPNPVVIASPTPEPTPPGGQQPGAPTPTPPPTPTPVLGETTTHQHRRLFPRRLYPEPGTPSVIREEETEGYEIFPTEILEEQELRSVCPLRPGYGPGEQILFPPTCGYRDIWTMLYLNKDRELMFAFPMSEGIWATGHWYGLRHTFLDHGVNLFGSYACDILGNVAGGKSPGFAYADCTDIRLDLDMQKIIGWQGAHIVLSFLDRNGKNLSQVNVGNQFTVNQIWGDQTINYYGLWLDQNFFDGWWNLKIGRYAATDEFTSTPLIYLLYVNNAICGQPQLFALNYVSAYPAAVWGGRLRYNDKEHNLYAMFGVYQTTNRLYKPAYHGIDFSIRSNDGLNLLWEIGWVPEFQPNPLPTTTRRSGKRTVSTPSVPAEEWHGMPGHYKFGVFYTPWRYIPQYYPQLNTFYSYGFYWLFDQMVYQAVPGTTQGLTLWTSLLYAPQQNTTKLVFQANGGLVYTGLIPRRSKDQLIFGAFYGMFSSKYASVHQSQGKGYPTYELVLEWGYRINLAPFFYIQPDLQYVINPGGTGRIQNAFVLGAQIGVSF